MTFPREVFSELDSNKDDGAMQVDACLPSRIAWLAVLVLLVFGCSMCGCLVSTVVVTVRLSEKDVR